MNFERLLEEHEFEQMLERVKIFDLFEFVKLDKQNRIELQMGTRHCDNGLWQDNFMCFVDGSKKYGDYYGFGSPFQRTEFLKLTYNDICKMFSRYDYKLAEIIQLNFFMDLKGV